jgi:site-specific DNA-methyltransferase (adenine-specific)
VTNPREGTIDAVLAGGAEWCVVEGEALTALAGMPASCVDALITDMPYSSGGQFRGDRMQSTGAKYVSSDAIERGTDFAGDNRDQRSFLTWCTLWLSEALRVAKSGAPCCLFTDWRQLPTTTDAIQAGGWVWRGIAGWDKMNARPMKGRFCPQLEFIAWGSRGPMSVDRDVPCLDGVFRHLPPGREREHQTAKSEALMLDVVAICEPKGIVLDLFAGSGTTGVAALRTGRRVVLVELVPEIARRCRERMLAESRGLDARAARKGQGSIFDRIAET